MAATCRGDLIAFVSRAFAGAALIACASCSTPQKIFAGHWVCEQTSAVALDLYPDGTATFSGMNLLDLKWKVVDPKWVRIDALGSRVTLNFRLVQGGSGYRGMLQATGFDTLTFVKKD